MNNTGQKVWLITGCSSGLGRALAEKVLETGATVTATSRSVAALDDLQAKYPNNCLPLQLDVTDSKQCEAVVQVVIEKTKRLDVLVNNAGYGVIGSLEETTDEQIERNFATIVFGAVHLMQAALPTFRAQRSGRIINISAAVAIDCQLCWLLDLRWGEVCLGRHFRGAGRRGKAARHQSFAGAARPLPH